MSKLTETKLLLHLNLFLNKLTLNKLKNYKVMKIPGGSAMVGSKSSLKGHCVGGHEKAGYHSK